jgi:polysaccharide biosynthesis protein PslG
MAFRTPSFPSATSPGITHRASHEGTGTNGPRVRPLIIAALVSVSILATGCAALTGTPRPVHAQGASALRHQVIFGMSYPQILTESTETQRIELAGMKQLGITSIRFDANWASIQPDGPGSFDWSQLDSAVSSVRQAGMSVDLIIDGCPQWAAVPDAGSTSWGQPASSAEFGSFAADVAERYVPQGVQIFEIWNEPNISAFWAPTPNAVAYTDDLKAAYTAIKAVDPQSIVISGGLAPITEPIPGRPGWLTAISFLQGMYAAGAKGYFDALGYHPYSFPDLPDTRVTTTGWSKMSESDPSLRSIMISHGDGAKPIWLTEFGAPSAGPSGVGQFMQAENLTEAIQDAKATDWIGALYIYTWQDDPTEGPSAFGILTVQGTRKLAYNQIFRSIRAGT